MNTLILLLGLAAFHPVHVSYTNIEITPETGEIGLVYKFFTDDLKLLFYHVYDHQIMLDTEKELSADDIDLISRHFAGSFLLKESGDNAVNLTFERKEQNDDSVWLFFRGKFVEKVPEKIVLWNALLLDLYEDQQNLVIVTLGKNEKGYCFNYLTRELTIELNK